MGRNRRAERNDWSEHVKPDQIIFIVAIVVSTAMLLTSGLPFLGGLTTAAISFSLLWVLSLLLRNASIVDIFWGPGFVVIGLFYLFTAPAGPQPRGLLAVVLASLWAIRLALHIALRNAGAGEDFRYAKWREQSGASFWWVSLFKVFLLQAVVLWIVSSPLLLAQLDGPNAPLSLVDGIAIVLFTAGFSFEALADWQLRRFTRDPANRGRVLSTGLWSRSRHPNYFGEAVLWWGLGLLALPVGGWLSLIGPALITFSLMRVSGVTMLDEALVERRPGYAEYIRDTPAFFPRLW
jgi:steroid 5-alpha reductase family enzyme